MRERIDAQAAAPIAEAIDILEGLGDTLPELVVSRNVREGVAEEFGAADLTEFERVAKQVRARQLGALEEAILTRQAEAIAARETPFPQGLFCSYDQRHPTYQRYRAIEEAHRERAKREYWERQESEFAQVVGSFLAMAAAAEIAGADLERRLMEQGVCPTCRGSKQVEVHERSVCMGCGGGGTSFNRTGGILCHAFHGHGYLGEFVGMKECEDCGGAGEYESSR